MGYRKNQNTHSIWLEYCSRNAGVIESLELPEWVFLSELNFREFVTSGKFEDGKFDFNQLDSSRFWMLFDFINEYFEMDISLFEAFEKARLKK